MSNALEELARLYDDEFFREYGAANAEYQRAAAFIANEIVERLAPTSAVDWGCGAGLHAAAMAQRGVDVVAVDGVAVCDAHRAPGLDPVIVDLRQPLPAGRVPPRYDLSLCVDVLEHIEPEHEAQVLRNITAGAAVAVFSCAPPGQGGHNHVNEQPRRYWIARMKALGWAYDRRATGSMENYFMQHRDVVTQSWMYHNLCIYHPTPG